MAEVVPRLEEWKKTNPKRIDDTWRHEHASNLLDDYMAEIKNFVKKKWSAKTFADDADEKSAFAARAAALDSFSFDPDDRGDPKTLAGQLNRELTAALHYYVRTVLEPGIITRLSTLAAELNTSELDALSWTFVRRLALNHTVKPDKVELLAEFTTARREDGMSISAWTDRYTILRSLLGADAPSESLCVQQVYKQVSPAEREHIPIKSTWKEWKKAVDDLDISTLPRFLASSVALSTARMPATRATPSDNAMLRNDQTSITCNYCHKRGHSERECRKKAKDGSGSKDDKVTQLKPPVPADARPPCSYCGIPRHNESKCRKKERDLAAGSRVMTRSATSATVQPKGEEKKKGCFNCGKEGHRAAQ